MAIGLVAFLAWRVTAALQARRSPAGPPPQRVALVQVEPAPRGKLVREAVYTGEVQAAATVDVFARIGGVVEQVRVAEGDAVSAGQVLIRLDPRELRYQLEQALAARETQRVQVRQAEAQVRTLRTQVEQARAGVEVQRARLAQLLAGPAAEQVRQAEEQVRQARAALEYSQAQLRRTEELFRQGFVAEQAVDAARTEVTVQEARLRAAEAQLALLRRGPSREEVEVLHTQVRQAEVALRQAESQAAQAQVALEHARRVLAQSEVAVRQAQALLAESVVRSPVQGVVAQRSVDPGDTVTPSARLLQLVRVEPAVVVVTVPERELLALRPGTFVEVTADALGDRRFAGRVVRVGPVLSPDTRTAEVRVEVSNPRGDLKPGMTARVRVVLGRREGVVTVPVQAVVRQGERTVVFVVEDGVARAREVTLGLSDGVRVELRGGVRAGESVVVAGQETLRDGVPVRTPPKEVRSAPSQTRRRP
ncbi:MAG: efflux RND transporter periplasmic adaptor subunit [Armatimonadota bacterium]|nr:efflux RND transporter periplasmic adaptor subunit [Armatimonadota bacterium]MDR7388196.1 efflux RND transporter periplasmic adaptor subunit [Armatimonadota bacterium]MDR7392990.1 efflux RND transporter periplasmic adaptor subunit [Armatimonadota bacterium]MDR7406297.1 efflux RND transporter periplasmic adaptor subunit [Armatimonadota bacterium]MDR7408489.1 efflux RND transporter periplasmic adaptor subunit [Armatimonadota bacterium]